MKEPFPYQDFLTGLSEISHLQFELWDVQGPFFTTAPSGPPSGDRESLVAGVRTLNQPQIRRGGEGYLAGAPLRNDGVNPGVLLAWGNGKRNGADADPEALEPFLLSLTELLGERWRTRAELNRVTTELSQSYEDIYLYSRLSSLIKTMHFSVGQIEGLVGEIGEALHADLAFAALSRERETIVTHNPQGGGKAEGADFAGRLIAAVPAETQSLKEHYLVINDSRLEPGYRELHADPYRALLVAIQGKKYFYGWIGVASFNMKEIFRRSELRLMISIAEQVNVLIDNTDLYNRLQGFIVEIVKSLVQAIEAKDTYTRGHSERVARYCSLIAEKMALDDEQKTNLQWAAILHDVGKIGISETILNKPGPLTADEYEQIKSHPTKGHAILRPLAPLKKALPGLLHHHERYDGAGYPDGLKGEKIPLTGRIIAVPDTFDAVNSDRAYRKGLPVEKSLEILKSAAGTQLDAQIVEMFVEIITNDPGLTAGAETGEGSG